jgi:hypothetical protein
MVLKSTNGRQKQEGSEKGEASGHLSRPEKHTRCYLRCIKPHSQPICGEKQYFWHFHMAGLAINPVQVNRTCRDLHWEFLRLWTGFELSSSWVDLPDYGLNLNRNTLDFMRWSDLDLGAQDLNDIQRPKSFQK